MMDNVLMNGINEMPMGWWLWVNWMMMLNTAAIVFAFKHVPARFIIGAFAMNAPFMMILAEKFGYVRLLGLSHIIFWTPLMVYLIMQVRKEDFDKSSIFGRYVLLVLVTDVSSLVIDYIDVIRYIAGDRGTG